MSSVAFRRRLRDPLPALVLLALVAGVGCASHRPVPRPEVAGAATGPAPALPPPPASVGVPEVVPSEPAPPAEHRPPPGPDVPWEPLFHGVDVADFTREIEGAGPVSGKVVRIELRADGLSFVATPDNGDRPGETDAWKTSTFLERTGCQLAINAAPFSPVRLVEGGEQDVAGFQVSGGGLVSPGSSTPALVISRDNRARIVDPPFPEPGPDAWNAVAGFYTVLRDGDVTGGDGKRHPRTAVGTSRDGRWLILLVVDGRQPGFSVGATNQDLGEWLRELGAWDGLNLDGGGTTTLVVEDADGNPRILNRPIHAGIPGMERPGASHLGVRAQRLP